MTQDTPPDNIDDVLIAMVTKHTNRTIPGSHPADVRSVLSQPAKTPKVQIKEEEIVVNGHKYVRQVQIHDIQYRVSQASRRKKGSLIDRGANGGIAGSDTRVIERHAHRTVDIRGIDNHEICSIPIVNAGAVVRSQRGEVIAIFNQYAYHPAQGRSIHSSCQLESFANDVNDRSIHTPGGLQRIKTVDGYVFPLSVRDGLPYLDMRPYTDDEYNKLPHVIFTSDVDWDPHILDFDVEGNDEWYDAISDNVNHTDLKDALQTSLSLLPTFGLTLLPLTSIYELKLKKLRSSVQNMHSGLGTSITTISPMSYLSTMLKMSMQMLIPPKQPNPSMTCLLIKPVSYTHLTLPTICSV